jgi:hypothetical protein
MSSTAHLDKRVNRETEAIRPLLGNVDSGQWQDIDLMSSPSDDDVNFEKTYLTSTLHEHFSNKTEILHENAYVNFFYGNSYIPLVETVIHAVHVFSTHFIIVYVAGETHIPQHWSTQFPRLIVYKMPKSSLHPWFDKLRAALMAPVINGVIVEADTIITPQANRLFDILKKTNSSTPLMPMHPDIRPYSTKECNISCNSCCVSTLPWPMAKRRKHGQYRHAHLMWTKRAKPFLRQTLKMCVENPKIAQCKSDESALNYALWVSDEKTYELCTQDPYFGVFEGVYFQNRSLEHIQRKYGPRTIGFMLCHGQKDHSKAKILLDRLINLYQQQVNVPWILSNSEMLTTVNNPHGLFNESCLI